MSRIPLPAPRYPLPASRDLPVPPRTQPQQQPHATLSAWALFLTLVLCGLGGFVMLTTACLLALLRGRS